MVVKPIRFNYTQGGQAKLKTGVKGNRRPRGAVRGGNGTFLVVDHPSQALITVEDENGNEIEFNMKYQLHQHYDRVTAQRAVGVYENLASGDGIEIFKNSSGYWEIENFDKYII